MPDRLKTNTKSIECQTMGHQGCTKTLVLEGGRYRTLSINHKVYGRLVTEKP